VRTTAQDVGVSPERALHLVRSSVIPAIPLEAVDIESPSATLILEAFRARFTKACDTGVWRRLSNAVLEPANPFDVKARRRLRQETVVLGALVLTALGLAVCFNLSAMAR
jgi:hypothetical protein